MEPIGKTYKENTLYSIIVPIFNVEKYITECIESIIHQTYRNIEIILVDDGSSDKCPNICDYYKNLDDRVKVIHKTNGGLVSARKAGALIAKGEYIFCVDGDDWISKQYIEKFNHIITEYAPDVICCGLVETNTIKENNREIQQEEGYYNLDLIKGKIHPIAIESNKGICFPHSICAKAFTKDIYIQEQLLVDDKIKIGEDGAVVKPILTKCKSLYVIKECLYYYRINNESMTKSRVSFDWEGPLHLYNHLNRRINVQNTEFYDQIQRRLVKELYTVVLSKFNAGRKYKQVKLDIKENLSRKEYSKILNNCKYIHPKQKIQHFLLKNRIVILLYIIHKFKKIK